MRVAEITESGKKFSAVVEKSFNSEINRFLESMSENCSEVSNCVD